MAAFSPSAFYGGNSEAFSESEDDFSDEDNYVAPSDTEESDSTEASEEEDEDGRDGGNNQNNTGPRGTDWTAYLDNLPDFDPLPFTVPNPGSQVSSSNVKCELDYFQLFFTDQLIEQIVRETNRYARDKISSAGVLQQYSIWKDWEDVRVEEFKAFLGVIVNMALNPKPELKEYFSNDLLKKMPFFPHVFQRKRFLQIFWMLHVAPSPHTSSGPPTRGSKIRDVVTYIDAKCREHFNAGPKICVDESTVGFKGRVSFKCYNPQKPTKWGMRVYALADCQTGYISAFEPYYGSTTTDSLCRPELPFTCRIVLHLLEKVEQATPGSGYHLYTDRFYTSLMLAEELLSHSILLTGTVMTNRKPMPQQLKKKMKKGEVTAYRRGNSYMALAWRDKRQVTMLSSAHNASTKEVTRKIAGGKTLTLKKPVVICDYTENMGAVDRADHYCASYAFSRKSMKWWRKLFFWLLEVSIVNSFILMRLQLLKQGEKEQRHLQYRRNLIEQLIGDVRARAGKRGPSARLDCEQRLDGKPHFIYKIPGRSSKDCAVCSDRKTKGGRRETVFFCKTCRNNPGLHPGECFERFHTLPKYR